MLYRSLWTHQSLQLLSVLILYTSKTPFLFITLITDIFKTFVISYKRQCTLRSVGESKSYALKNSFPKESPSVILIGLLPYSRILHLLIQHVQKSAVTCSSALIARSKLLLHQTSLDLRINSCQRM